MISKALLYAGSGILLAAGLAIWFLWAHLQDAEREAHIWQQNAQTAEHSAHRSAQAARELANEKARAERIAIEREAENRRLRASNEQLKGRLSVAIEESSDEIQECLALPVPASLADIVREYPDLRAGSGDDQD